jgi:hypothetical protein
VWAPSQPSCWRRARMRLKVATGDISTPCFCGEFSTTPQVAEARRPRATLPRGIRSQPGSSPPTCTPAHSGGCCKSLQNSAMLDDPTTGGRWPHGGARLCTGVPGVRRWQPGGPSALEADLGDKRRYNAEESSSAEGHFRVPTRMPSTSAQHPTRTAFATCSGSARRVAASTMRTLAGLGRRSSPEIVRFHAP